MSLSPPTIDPYVVLGVKKDATLPEIKSAHRKLVLKCHPDKVKDESLRNAAQDEFQRVQQAYELLSDETKRTRYDQKVRLAELRKEAMERAGGGSSPYSFPRTAASSGAREYRDGRVYEERVPADARFYEEEVPVTEETQPASRRYDTRRKQRSKATDEKTRSKAEPSDFHRTREYTRESLKATHAERAKYRSKTRRREASDKYAPYFESADESSGSERPFVVKVRPAESKRTRETYSSRKTKPESSPPRRDPRYYEDGEDEYPDSWKTKHERLQTSAQDYIMRSRGNPPIEVDRRARPSNSPPKYSEPQKYEHGYTDGEPEPRRSTRTHSRRDTTRTSREPPSMPTSYSSPAGIKIPSSAKPPLQSARSSPAAYASQKESSSRSDNPLSRMVPPPNSGSVRTSKVKGSTDEGYSSPGTPEMRQNGNSPKPPVRYKIPGDKQDTIVVEPAETSYRHQRSVSPVRPEGPSVVRPSMSSRTGSQPTRTYTYSPEVPCRFQSVQTPSSRPSYSHGIRFKEKDIKVAPEIKPSNVSYTPDYYRSRYDDPPLGRRQSTY
ncbi:DnaJ domain protein [Paecilomyces variotii]|uniref:DnaJ domain protein n=1 Tax=Byssochlamys spectabilis TaxID=264951 RepID=A0A443HQT6_BYSSP|nr:DnaJ domain protein [Paecilomyces variotii]KAJ9220926.1 hypothetical protein DTO169C6_6739 [Paecilomyces variotii]KAJ9236986.1 hypothetical protein DTO169E5_5467 [Paecilomyces variotii]KAJ9246892.1 hypothetical protein DTO207G8_8502 [Paecilomyces variotii]KAJ9269547.1 hypothetical protein DTO212C5_4398 [Paecilomyces variotii]KAJ9295887.1 hypothetical protein DTO217A2_8949 [Paecilomyces variotii]